MAIAGITLVDIKADLVSAWQREFATFSDVRVSRGSIFDAEANALVSPANSFGVMDGGLDDKLRDFFGSEIEHRVRSRFRAEFHGELPVGLAIVVETGHPSYPYLVSAPTMRYPDDVSNTVNAYLAMKGLLNAAAAHPTPLRLAIPGLCALSGRMPANVVARQMRIAYERVVLGRHSYSHWREERAFERFIRGEIQNPPEDLEAPFPRQR